MMKDTIGQVYRVVHLAAAVGVRKIIESPVETITTNVRGTEIVLDCCDEHGTPLYLASTSEIYGKGGDKLHEEHDWVMGSTAHRRWSYVCTKALDEFLALAYHQEKGLPVILGRFFNTVGPRQSGEWGMVVPTFVTQALAGDPITVYGSAGISAAPSATWTIPYEPFSASSTHPTPWARRSTSARSVDFSGGNPRSPRIKSSMMWWRITGAWLQDSGAVIPRAGSRMCLSRSGQR
jgi:hypothetical protein